MNDPARILSEPLLWAIAGAGGVVTVASLVPRRKPGALWWTLIGLGVLGAAIKSLDLLHWETPWRRLIALLGLFGLTLYAAMSRQGLRPGKGFAGLSGVWPTKVEGSTTSHPDRVVLWIFAPAVLILTAGLVAGWVAGESVEPFTKVVRQLLELFFVTALGEELLFRGFLSGLGLLATRPGRVGSGKDRTGQAFWVVSGAFGLWHVPDALKDGHVNEYSIGAALIWAAGTVLFTTLASRYLLIPLRMRTGSILAPTLAHFAANATGIVFGLDSPAAEVQA